MIGMPFALDCLRMRAPDEFDQGQSENPLAEPFMPRDFETLPPEMGIDAISQDFLTPPICRLHMVDKDRSVEQACWRDVLRGGETMSRKRLVRKRSPDSLISRPDEIGLRDLAWGRADSRPDASRAVIAFVGAGK